MNDDGVESVPRKFQNRLCGEGFRLGVGAVNVFRGEIRRFFQYVQGLFGNGVHGADVYEFFDMVFEGEEKEIFCSLHIDLQEFIGHVIRNGNDSRGMDEDDFLVLAFEEKRTQRIRIGHVALDVFDVFGKFGNFVRKDESADFFAAFRQ